MMNFGGTVTVSPCSCARVVTRIGPWTRILTAPGVKVKRCQRLPRAALKRSFWHAGGSLGSILMTGGGLGSWTSTLDVTSELGRQLSCASKRSLKTIWKSLYRSPGTRASPEPVPTTSPRETWWKRKSRAARWHRAALRVPTISMSALSHSLRHAMRCSSSTSGIIAGSSTVSSGSVSDAAVGERESDWCELKLEETRWTGSCGMEAVTEITFSTV
mmetsp:Transcript_89797/g.254364  ORF Transcript_89797/g.254364 Transcript_89797/m.254364 type:complete len:216 (+) Transcript_89797:463-1110(+)